MDKITGTWELLLSDYWRNGMIIDEKIDLQSSWKKNSCQSFGLIPFRILSVRTNFCQSQITFNKMNCDLMLTSDTPTLWQTGSRNLTGQKYVVPIWSLWPNIRFLPSIVAEKNVTKNGHIYTKCMFNVHKNQQSRQTESRNLMDPKTLPTIWGTYMKLVIKYQISAINSCWEKCDEKCALCSICIKTN